MWSNSLKSKIIIPVGGLMTIIVGLIIGVIAVSMTRASENDARDLADSIGYHYGYMVKNRLDTAMITTIAMAGMLEGAAARPTEVSRSLLDRQLYNILASDEFYFGDWVVFEPNTLDGRDSQFVNHNKNYDATGRYAPYFLRENGQISSTFASGSEEGDWYQLPKKTLKPMIIEPYVEPDADNQVMTSVVAPLQVNGRFIGVTGIDIILTTLNDVTAQVKPYETGYGFIVSNAGTLVTSPQQKLIGQSLEKALGPRIASAALSDIKASKIHRAEFKDANGRYLLTFVPFAVNGTATPWAFAVAIPKSKVLAAASRLNFLAVTLGLFGVLCMVAVVYLNLCRVVIKPIEKVTASLADLAEGDGDLTKRLPAQASLELETLAHWFNSFMEKLEQVIGTVRCSAMRVADVAGEVAAGSQGLSHSTMQEASTVEEVASTVEEMSSAVVQNSENAGEGLRKVNECVQTIRSSALVSAELTAAMNDVSVASGKISEIITTVNEVAFQTNLLAMNAAVEAARAGEHGKGFAVVAGEVRALAQRSADAAKEIQSLINDTGAKIAHGDEMVNKTAETLDTIGQQVEVLSSTIEEVAATSSEQAHGIDELNRAIAQIDGSAQQNAGTVEELASASERLRNEAMALNDNVSRFRISVDAECRMDE